MMIDPQNICVGRPIYDHAVPEHQGSMVAMLMDHSIGAVCDRIGEPIASARDYIVHYFLTRTACDWLVWIDADISFSRQDWDFLMENQAGELAVCAEYLKKTRDLSLQVANFGLGFARVHRNVYMQLDALTRDDGEPRLPRYRSWVDIPDAPQAREEFVEYHPIGIHPDGSHRNEDHGFWLMVRLAGIAIRKETRTHLGHTGPYTRVYDKERLDAAIAASGAQ